MSTIDDLISVTAENVRTTGADFIDVQMVRTVATRSRVSSRSIPLKTHRPSHSSLLISIAFAVLARRIYKYYRPLAIRRNTLLHDLCNFHVAKFTWNRFALILERVLRGTR